MKGLIHTVSIEKRGIKQEILVSGATGTLAAGQTITGAVSGATAKVIAATPIITETPSKNFNIGESISTATWTANFLAIGDYFNAHSETEYYSSSVTSTARLYKSKDSIKVAGEHMILTSRMVVMLPPDATIDHNDRIISTVEGYSGTWEITSINPHYGGKELHHYSCELAGVTP